MFYAQLREDGVCIGISELSGQVEGAHMIEIPDYDLSLLGKKYNREALHWEEVEQPPSAPISRPSTIEEIKENQLILMDALATTFEEILALRAIVEGGSS